MFLTVTPDAIKHGKYKLSSVFTINGDAAVDQRIEEYLRKVVEAALKVPHNKDIVAIILGGGYGRGEGGVSFDEQGNAKLYNDFDLFVISADICRKRRKQLDSELHECSETAFHGMEIDVDFGPCRNLSELSRTKFTMMWQELKMGHKVIYGPEDILSVLPDYDLNNLPWQEGARLLMNRGTGLLLAQQKIEANEHTAEDLEFIARNLMKAVMACGDSYLIARKDYSYLYRERPGLLEKYRNDPLIDKFYDLYCRSIEFKFGPTAFDINRLTELFIEVRGFFREFYIFYFSRFCDKDFSNLSEVQDALYRNSKLTPLESPLNILKNIILNVLELGNGCWDWRFIWRYPRLRLFIVLPCLLFDSEANMHYITLIAGEREFLGLKEVLKIYLKLWCRFN